MNCETAARTAGADHSFAGKVRVGIDRATLYAAVAAAPAALGMKMVPMKNRRRVASFAHDTAPPRNTHSLTRTYYTRRKRAERHFKTMVLNKRQMSVGREITRLEQPTFISIAVAS